MLLFPFPIPILSYHEFLVYYESSENRTLFFQFKTNWRTIWKPFRFVYNHVVFLFTREFSIRFRHQIFSVRKKFLLLQEICFWSLPISKQIIKMNGWSQWFSKQDSSISSRIRQQEQSILESNPSLLRPQPSSAIPPTSRLLIFNIL